VVANTGLVAGTYTLTATADGGNEGQNCNATAQLTIFQPEIAVSVSGIATNATCFGEADGSIAVTKSDGATVVITNANNDVVANTRLVAGTYTLTATADAGNEGQNCTATAQVTINQPEIAVAVSAIATNATCFGEADGSIAVTNSQGSTAVITNANNEVVANTGLVAGTYTLTATANGGNEGNSCTATAQVTISQPDDIEPITAPDAICNTDRTLEVDLDSYLPTDLPLTGNWVDLGSTDALNKNILRPYDLPNGEYTFDYEITINGCPLVYKLIMQITDDNCGIVLGCGDVFVNNAFSPNNDGVNEEFFIDNIDDTICYPDNIVQIYNRWGVLVFETKNYNNTTNKFTGVSRGRTTISESSGLPTGTYFYVLSYSSVDNNNNVQTNTKDGYLYLTR
jgi:gliding motility-associated-like protein